MLIKKKKFATIGESRIFRVSLIFKKYLSIKKIVTFGFYIRYN